MPTSTNLDTLAPPAPAPDTNPQAGRSAVVTGATSGLGYAAAKLLAEQGAALVVVTGRTAARAEEAARELRVETGLAVFRPLELDLSDPVSPGLAAARVAENNVQFDAVILNAGMVSGSGPDYTEDGIEVTIAASLIGHHRFGVALLERDLLAESARIVIAGSEAARGDLPTFNPIDLAADAAQTHDGDLVAAARAVIAWDPSRTFKPGDVYATTKLFVAWWAAELADRLPAGMVANAVSPGSAPNTKAVRNGNFFMRRIMVPVIKAMPKFMGLAATTPVAAQRYLDATTWSSDATGNFYASAPKKMTGPLHRVVVDHVLDRSASAAAWSAVVQISEADLPASVG